MSKIKLIITIIILNIFLLPAICEENNNARDYLYSEEYFDYLIECANEEAITKKEEQEEILLEKDDITVFEFGEEQDDFEPFKLKIEENSTIANYKETFEKPITKIIIPTSEKLNFTYDTKTYINKNYTDGRRISSGFEYIPFKHLSLASGIETNYRDVDHNPLSRKLYFTPSVKLNEHITISFLNKVNVQTNESDHDIGLYVSPFKNQALDFKIFTGMSKGSSGVNSQSASFYTNFYFF